MLFVIGDWTNFREMKKGVNEEIVRYNRNTHLKTPVSLPPHNRYCNMTINTLWIPPVCHKTPIRRSAVGYKCKNSHGGVEHGPHNMNNSNRHAPSNRTSTISTVT